MFYAVMLLGTFTIIEAVKSTYEVAGYTTDTVKCNVVRVLLASAAGTYMADDTCVSAARVAVNGVVDSSVADS